MRYVIARGGAGVLGMVAIESRRTPEGGAMASRGRKEGEGMVAAVLLFSAALSKQPLAVSSDTGQVFYGSNGVNGAGWGKQNGKSF